MANEVTGARDTYSGVQGLRKLDIREDILRYDPNLAPLTVISGRLDSKPTVNPQFTWYEKDRPTRRTTCSTTGTGTTLTMADGGLFAEHDVWKNTLTGENVRVVDVSGNVVTVVRGATPVAITNGDEFLRVGAAQQEGDTSKEPRSYNPVARTNYTQITRTTYAATRTWQQSERLLRGTDWQEIADDDDTYGVSVSKFRNAGYTLSFVMHRLMDDSTTYENDILVLDFNPDGKNLIRQRYLTGGDYGSSNTHVREHIEEPDRDGRKDEVLTEDGLEFGLEKTHGLMRNITS
jgi:hypothetical protein